MHWLSDITLHTCSTRLIMGRHAPLTIILHTGSTRLNMGRHALVITLHTASTRLNMGKHAQVNGYHTSQAAQDLTWGDMHWLSHFTGSIRLRKDGCYILELSFPKKILRQATMRQHEDFSAKSSNMKNVCPSESK